MYRGLFGIETEVAVSDTVAHGDGPTRGGIAEQLMRAARARLRWLPDGGAGVFLQNGSRIYLDVGGHPEVTTPECNDPLDAVRYVRAGEDTLFRLCPEHGAIFRTNVDYAADESTWGSHECYLCTRAPRHLAQQLLPHLVTRLIYTGAGGFNSRAAGLEFSLSPRVQFLTQAVSHGSTAERGIFHDKDESLAGVRYHRLHLICGETLCSDRALWLRIGTTALVVALCDANLTPGTGVELAHPVDAMRQFAADPTCRATAQTTHGPRTAIAIQRHYLAEVEARLGASFLPPWAGTVCAGWRAVLDDLEADPRRLSTTLDWPIKHALYEQHLRQRGFTWDTIALWSPVATEISYGLTQAGLGRITRFDAESLLGARSPVAPTIRRLTPMLRERGLHWDDLGRFLTVRNELCELDVRFGQLGPRGVFNALDAAGVLAHRLADARSIAAAVELPPHTGRAWLRGGSVRALTGNESRYLCTWEGIWDAHTQRTLDLTDPFTRHRRWTDVLPAGHPLVRLAAHRPHAFDPIELNQQALDCRKRGDLPTAERLLRRAIRIEDTRVPRDSPKRPHRRNNLAMVLLRAERWPEATVLNLTAWRLKGERHDLTSGRILFVRTALRLLGNKPDVLVYLGQLKTLFQQERLECFGDIAATWDIPDVLDMIRAALPRDDAGLLVDLAAVLNERAQLPRLEAHPRWREAEPLPLASRWPR